MGWPAAGEGVPGPGVWSALGRREDGVQSGYGGLADLWFALENGWAIEPPIYADHEPGWRPYYHIILRRGDRRVLLSLPQDEALHQCLDAHGIPVEIRRR